MNNQLRAGRMITKALYQTTKSRLRRGPLLPSWTFQFEVVVAMLREDWQTLWQHEAHELRAYTDSLMGSQRMVKRCQHKRETIGGVLGDWFIPPKAQEGTALLYFHGGSYLFGSSKTHGDVMARFALYSGLSVFAPAYRLAPEHPWPAQLDDALAVFEALSARRLIIAGDSAGGHLVLSMARALHRRGAKIPIATVAISPWLDMLAKSDSYQRNALYDYGKREMLLAQAKQITGDKPPESLSLLDLPPTDLGPLLIQGGSAELLIDEITQLATQMQVAGYAAELDVLPEMPHASSNLAAFCAEGDRAVQRACDFIKRVVATQTT